MRRRRRPSRAAELTPLIDVLFILLFASLVQARTTVERDTAPAEDVARTRDAGAHGYDAGAHGPDAAVPDAAVHDAGARDAADASADAGPSEHLAQSREIAARLASAVDNRDVFVVEIDGDGYVTAMARWQGGEEVRRDRVRQRLVRPVLPGESDQELVYLGSSDAAMRVCPLARERFERAPDDSDPFLVLVLLEVPLVELPLALYRGLTADLRACFAEAAGVGILLQPGDDDHGIP